MSGSNDTATIGGKPFVPPPGWARLSDRILARVRARALDDELLSGGVTDGSAVILVRRARLLDRRHRSAVARALRKLVEAARQHERHRFVAKLPLRETEIMENEPLILTLADELEDDSVSPRGVILADRLIRDGDSPVYGLAPVTRPRETTVEAAVKHARAALHLG